MKESHNFANKIYLNRKMYDSHISLDLSDHIPMSFFLLYCVHKNFSEISTIPTKPQSSAILEQQESRTSEILETGGASAIPEHTQSTDVPCRTKSW